MAYSFFWNAFPAQLSDIKDALPLALDIYRGNAVDHDQASLALFNCAGFIYKATLGKGGPQVFAAAPSATKAEVEAAFASAIATANEPSAMQATSEVAVAPWLAIIAPVVIDLLRKWLKI